MENDLTDPKKALAKRQKQRANQFLPATELNPASDKESTDRLAAADIYSMSAAVIAADYVDGSNIVFQSPTNPYWASDAGSVGFGVRSPTDIHSMSAAVIAADYVGGSNIVFQSPTNPYWASDAGSVGFGVRSPTDIYSMSAAVIAADYVGGSNIVFQSPTNPYWASDAGSIGLGIKSRADIYSMSAAVIAADYVGGSNVVFQSPTNPCWVSDTTFYDYATPSNKYAANKAIYWEAEVQIKQQRFEVTLPLRFNNGRDVPAEMLEKAKLELLDLFGGVSYVVGGGLWKQAGVVFPDSWIRIIVEAPDLDSNERLMKQFKERWRLLLDLIDLRLTSQAVKVF